jgi:hypothetical protein
MIKVIPFGCDLGLEVLARIVVVFYQNVLACLLRTQSYHEPRKISLREGKRIGQVLFQVATTKIEVAEGGRNQGLCMNFGSTASVSAVIKCLRDQNPTQQPETYGL